MAPSTWLLSVTLKATTPSMPSSAKALVTGAEPPSSPPQAVNRRAPASRRGSGRTGRRLRVDPVEQALDDGPRPPRDPAVVVAQPGRRGAQRAGQAGQRQRVLGQGVARG